MSLFDEVLHSGGSASHLPVGVLHGNFAITKRENVTALHLDLSAVRASGCEHPLRDTSVFSDEVSCVVPARVWEILENLINPVSNLILAGVDGALHRRSTAGLEDAVRCHH